MKSQADILIRVQYLQHRIDMLGQQYQAQLDLPHGSRDCNLMKFLLEEQSTYQLALSQLTWVLELSDDHNE